MGMIELLLIAVGLSMDAFAVSIGKGLAMKKLNRRSQLVTGLYFGGFQALMPVIGYFVARNFRDLVTSVDHFIAFFLLAAIGVQMLREARNPEEVEDTMAVKKMLILAVATSIDALAVGISFAFLPGINIFMAAGSIGIITFLLSALGVKIGNVFGSRYRSWSTILGGIILIGMGVKILIEHTCF